MHVFAKGGSLMENPEKNGLAHFMEHMLLQGTPHFKNAHEISHYIETLAGSFNAYTNDREISFHVSLPYTYTKEAIDLAYDIWFSSTFPEDAFVKEKRAVLSEAAQRLDGLGYKLGKFGKDMRFKEGTKLRQFTIGLPEVIQKIQLEDTVNYWKQFFTTDNTYVLVIGNMDIEEVKKQIQATFGSVEKTSAPTLFTSISGSDFAPSGVYINHDEKLQSNYVDISIPSLPLETERRKLMTAGLATTIFGGLTSSRLQKVLRWEKGLVYGASIDSYAIPHLGETSCSTEMRSEQYYEAMELMTDLLVEFMHKGPTDDEMAHAKQYIHDRRLMVFDEPSRIVGWFKHEFLWRDKIMMPEETLEILKTITKEEVNAVLSELNVSGAQIIQQGPQADDAKLRGFLETQLTKIQAK